MAPPTDRQMQIAELRNKGLTQGQIAEKLGIARSTVARDWSAVKAEMSELPLGYEEPTVINPVNSPNLSNSIVVTLTGLDFEKFRNSNVLYSKSVNKERFERDVVENYVFEARNNNIVHSTWLGRTPAGYYPLLSKISLKHSIDATKLLADIVDFFFKVIRAIEPETGLVSSGMSVTRRIKGRNVSANLGKVVDTFFPKLMGELEEGEVDQVYKIATSKWLTRVEERQVELISILNRLLSQSFDVSAYEMYRFEPVEDVVEIILGGLTSISPEAFEEAQTQYSACTKPYDVSGFHMDNVIDAALGMYGILDDEIPIAREHKIANPERLHSFLDSGAQTVDEYNGLIEAGFESTDDRDEFREMWEVITSMPPLAHANVGGWEFSDLNNGEIHKKLLQKNWTRKRLLIAKEVHEATGKRIDFDTGPTLIDAFDRVNWPVNLQEREMLKSFTNTLGLENLLSWITPKYEHELINFAITSRRHYNFPHARATFEALLKRGHVFDQMRPQGGIVNHMDDAFLQKYGLGWAKSDLTPGLYLVLQIVRKSYQKQIPTSNLLREVQGESKSAYYVNEEVMKKDISENLSKYCVVQPNGIVQIVGRRKQPVSNQDAIELDEQKRQEMLKSFLLENPQNITKEALSRQLGVEATDLPYFFERLDQNEIHALRLARVIRDDDLPQACHLVWRYFVKLVARRKPAYKIEEDTFVHDIEFVAEEYNLKKGQINVLHDVRKIRNDTEHSNDIKPPNPTWKRVVGVLKVCELLE